MAWTKRKCHESGSSIFFDDLASQRYYLPISSPPHRERIKSFQSVKTMWEICFERGAKSIFRLSGEDFRQTGQMGMMCLADGEMLKQEDGISSEMADGEMLKQEDGISSEMATEKYKNKCRWI